jgi:HEAT repeat protein
MESGTAELPHLSRRGAKQVMDLWNRYFEFQEGSGMAGLIRIAQSSGLDYAAWEMLHHGNLKNQLVACITLGNLQVKRAWLKLRGMVENEHTILSLAAARALAKIDRVESVGIIIPMVVKRNDWPPVIVANLLRRMGADAISIPLAKAVLKAPGDQAPRLLHYLDEAHYSKVKHVIYRRLAESQDDQTISACLKAIKEVENLDMIRTYLDHPTWFVRVQAVKLLSGTGLWDDEQRLINMLSDRNWWVRYRTAQVLADMPFMDKDKLLQIIENHWDRFAKDSIKMVMAEKQLI